MKPVMDALLAPKCGAVVSTMKSWRVMRLQCCSGGLCSQRGASEALYLARYHHCLRARVPRAKCLGCSWVAFRAWIIACERRLWSHVVKVPSIVRGVEWKDHIQQQCSCRVIRFFCGLAALWGASSPEVWSLSCSWCSIQAAMLVVA